MSFTLPFESYQGTALKISSLTAKASRRATITAQVSRDGEWRLVEELALSVGVIVTSP
jgi:hypothetical protein